MSYAYAISPSAGTNVATLTSGSASTGRGTVTWYGLTSGTSYTITITAINTWGTITSTGLSVSTPAELIAPSAPQLSLVGTSANSFVINWAGATRATSYTYAISPNQGSNVPTVSGTSGTVTWSGLTVSTSYTVTITAINAVGSTASEILANTPGVLPGTSAWLQCSSSSDGTKLVIGTFQTASGVFTSADSGVTWTARAGSGIPASAQYYGTASSSDGSRLITGINPGIIYISTNYGVSWTAQTIDPSARWFAFAGSSDGRTLIATAYDVGFVYTSIDFGVTWRKAVSILPAGKWYGTASSSNGTIMYIANNNGNVNYVYRSTDSGINWTQLTSLGTSGWGQFACSSDGTKVAIGKSGGNIWTSTDSGTTWTARTGPGTGTWPGLAMSSDGTKLVAAKASGNIWTSTNSGVTWTERTGAGTGNWQAMTSSSDGVNLAVGNNGSLIYTSCDSGVTWRAVSNIAPLAPQLSVTATTPTSLTIAWIGAAGAMSYTYAISPSAGTNVPTLTSGGCGNVVFSGLTASTSYTITITAVNTWGSLASSGLVISTPPVAGLPGTRPWLTCSGSSDGTKLVIGTFTNAGGVYTSTDSGITWTSRVGSGIPANLQYYGTFSSSDGSKLVTGSQGGNIYRSTNFGMSWSSQSIDADGKWFAFAGSSDGRTLVTGDYDTGFVYTSTDFGITWIKAVTGLPASAYWYACASSSDGTKLIIGDNNANAGGYLYTSTDSGVTWTQRTSFGTSRWYGIASSSDGTKLVTGKFGGYIFTSTDSGANWIQRGTTTPGTGSWNTFASSSDGTKLVTAKDSDYIYTSVDSGVTWTQRIGGGTGAWQGIASSSDGVNLALGKNGSLIYTSCDSGVTWRASDAIAPLAPQLSVSATTPTSLTIAWIGAAGAMSYSYDIFPYVATNVVALTSGSASTGRGTVTWTELIPSTSYTIRITALNTWGSATSSALVVTTPAA
jgi:hypothetical protein